MVRKQDEDKDNKFTFTHIWVFLFEPFRRLLKRTKRGQITKQTTPYSCSRLKCFTNGPVCLKDLIRKQLFGCHFLRHVQKSNQAPIAVTTVLAEPTLVVWFTVMLLPSVAVEWCPGSNGVRLLKLTEAIPRKSPFCHGLLGKYLPAVALVPREAKYSNRRHFFGSDQSESAEKSSLCCHVAAPLRRPKTFPVKYL